MKDLYLAWSPIQRKNLFIFAIVTALLVTAFMNVISKPLTTPAAPAGIVSFELAGTAPQARLIIHSWDAPTKLLAAFSLGFDYLYMLVYSIAISLGCYQAGLVVRAYRWPLETLGGYLVLEIWLAAGFDAIENLALTLILIGGSDADFWPALARSCALVKFSLIFLALVYVLYGLTVWLVSKRSL